MKLWIVSALFVSSLTFANGKDWSKPVFSDGCGFSNGEAKSQAEAALQNEGNYYQSVCEGAGGKFSLSEATYSCETEPQTITCKVTCSGYATASCKF